MSRKSKSSTPFVAPRGKNGKFLPIDQWPKSVRKEFERLKKNGAFKNPAQKNPIVTSSRGRRKGKDIWIPPQNKATGQFLPMDEWSAADKRAYKKALREGLVPGNLVPRGYAGRFASEGAPRHRARQAEPTQLAIRPQDFDPYDVDDIKRGIRRLEHRIDDLTYEVERSDRYTGGAVRGARTRAQDICRHCGGLHAVRPSGIGFTPRYRRTTVVPYADDPESDREFEEMEEEYSRTGYKRPDYLEPIDAEWEDRCDDPCQASILEEAKRAGDACERALAKISPMVPNRTFSRNRAIRTLMYNRPKLVGRGFDSIVDYVKEHPILTIIGLGTAAVVGYALYRMVKSIISTVSVGTGIRNGVMSFPGGTDYLITQDDSLWLIRAIWGEVNRSNQHWETPGVQRGAAAVMWSLANNYMTVGRKRSLFPTFGQFIQAYCQPINPIWASAGAAGCQRNPGACSDQTLAFRQGLRSKPWSQFPAGAQALVTAFVAGTLANPIGRRTDWAAAGQGRRTADAVNVAGNVFITDPNARSRTGAGEGTAIV